MGIENDIKQTTFKSEKHKAMINVIYTYGWIMERIKNLLGKEQITPQQYNILRILRGSFPQPLSTLQIRERMLDKMSDTSRIVDRLVAKQLVKKCTCPKDKRLVDVTITEKGQELLKNLDEGMNFDEDIMKNWTEQEARLISELMDKLRNRE